MKFTASLALLFLMCVSAFAQAGRKFPTPLPTPTPAPAALPTPTPPPAAATPALTKTILKVAYDVPGDQYRVFVKPENMQAWVVERLRDSLLVDVRNLGQLNRRDAVNAAKADQESYVVYLHLDDDPFTRNTTAGQPTLRTTYIDVAVFHPNTGKTKYSTRIYLNDGTRRAPTLGTMISTCHPNIYGVDLYLLQASIEAAETVMGTFGIPIPPDCRHPSI